MTDHELKLALAKELPELIGIRRFDCWPTEFHWIKQEIQVTEREWLWIVAECEKKLDELQDTQYQDALLILTYPNTNTPEPYSVESLTVGCLCLRVMITDTWQQRAEAYFKIKYDNKPS